LLAPRAPIAPAGAIVEQQALPDLQLAGQLFGSVPGAAPAVAAAAAANIQVVGILSAGSKGSAVLAVDGKPAKAFGVGDRVTPSQLVAEVLADGVVVDTNGIRSQLPAPTKASLAVLTSGANRPKTAPEASAGTPAGTAGPPPAAMPTGVPAGMPGAQGTVPLPQVPGLQTANAPGPTMPPAGMPAPAHMPSGPMPPEAANANR